MEIVIQSLAFPRRGRVELLRTARKDADTPLGLNPDLARSGSSVKAPVIRLPHGVSSSPVIPFLVIMLGATSFCSRRDRRHPIRGSRSVLAAPCLYCRNPSSCRYVDLDAGRQISADLPVVDMLVFRNL